MVPSRWQVSTERGWTSSPRLDRAPAGGRSTFDGWWDDVLEHNLAGGAGAGGVGKGGPGRGGEGAGGGRRGAPAGKGVRAGTPGGERAGGGGGGRGGGGDRVGRERLSTSGAKSDPGDARVLAEIARLDGHNHRPIAGDSDLAEAVKVLARAHQTMIWTRQRHTNQIRSTLREFYPGALDAFDDLASGDAIAVLMIAPTPALGRGLSRSKIAAALRRGGRQRRVDERAAEIQTALRARTARSAGDHRGCHGRIRRRARRRHRRARRADHRARGRNSRTVLNSTRTPKSSVPCQDWG